MEHIYATMIISAEEIIKQYQKQLKKPTQKTEDEIFTETKTVQKISDPNLGSLVDYYI